MEPVAVSMRWPDDEGDLEVTVHLAVVEGRAEPVGLDLRTFRRTGPERPSRALPGARMRPITTYDLRGLRLAEIVAEARRRVASALLAPTGDEEWDATPWAGGLEEAWTPAGRGRPPLYGPEHFREVAEVYRSAFAIGMPPTLAVAKRFTVTKSTAAKWIAKARALGLLPPTTRGRARVATPEPPPRQAAKAPRKRPAAPRKKPAASKQRGGRKA
jgi:hypothetical protein